MSEQVVRSDGLVIYQTAERIVNHDGPINAPGAHFGSVESDDTDDDDEI